MNTSWVPKRFISSAAVCLLGMCATASARDKADVIVMRNGDRLTGQILVMQYGKLSLKTDYLGTALIEWLDIARAESPQQFVVEDIRGRYFAGTLAPSAVDRRITIIHEDGAQTSLGLDEIGRVYAGETTFLNRLNGSLSVGFDYAKASDISTITGSFDTTYRAPEFRWNVTADVHSTKDPEQGTIDRMSIGYTYQWLLEQQRFVSGLALLERNEETGVEARAQLGAALGKYFVQTSKSELSAMVGAALTREWATGSEGSQESIEGIVGGNWRLFRFNSPTITLNSTALLFPSLTDAGRYRTNLNISLRRELVKDFYLDLSFYHAYDNEPPDENAETTDYGFTTSLGYSFY
jgi:putative salt-induced outer membrane protein YdiY